MNLQPGQECKVLIQSQFGRFSMIVRRRHCAMGNGDDYQVSTEQELGEGRTIAEAVDEMLKRVIYYQSLRLELCQKLLF